MNLKNKLVAVTDFVPFASTMTFLICLRTSFPKLYNFIENNYSNTMVKTDGAFQTIVPQRFLNWSTLNFQVVKSTWNSCLLSWNTKANVGINITNYDLPIVNSITLSQIQLSELTKKNPNKYYILNFGSSS
jgi:hypothetical protein